MMTKITRIMHVVMMALAVIMSLGAASPAEAQTIEKLKKGYQETKEFVEDPEGKTQEVVDEQTEKKFGVAASDLYGAWTYWTEGNFLKVWNYNPGTYIFIGLMLILCSLYYFRNFRKKDGAGFGLDIFLIVVMIVLPWFYQFLYIYPGTTTDSVHIGLNVLLGLSCVGLLLLRIPTFRDFFKAWKGGKLRYWFGYLTHPFQRGEATTSQGGAPEAGQPVTTGPQAETVPETVQPAPQEGQPAEGQPATAPAAADRPPSPVARVVAMEQGEHCPQCGEPLGPDPGNFCTRCRCKLTEGPVAVSPPPAPVSPEPAPEPAPTPEAPPPETPPKEEKKRRMARANAGFRF